MRSWSCRTGESVLPELVRTWEEAAHHIELARRRGEAFVSRETLFVPPPQMASRLARFGTLRLSAPPQRAASAASADVQPAGPAPDVAFPIRPPETISRDLRVLRRLQRDGLHTVILCDNAGRPSASTNCSARIGPVVGVAGHRRAGRRLRRAATWCACSPTTRSSAATGACAARASTPRGAALDTLGALKPGDYVVHLEHGIGIYRGIEKIFVRESTIEAAVIEYEGGDRLNVPLYRIDQIERYRSAQRRRPRTRRHRACTSWAGIAGSSSARRRAWRSSR